jgi:hypothetical protein
MNHHQLQQALKLLREEGKDVKVKLNSKTCVLQAEYNRIQQEAVTAEETAVYQIITENGLISLETNHESIEEFISSGVLDSCVNVDRYECGDVRNFDANTLYCELPTSSQVDAEYQKPYEEMAQALSDLSGIEAENIYLKIENVAENMFLPPQNIYKIFGHKKQFSEYEVESKMIKNKRTCLVGAHDALADAKGVRQGFVL